MLTLNQIASTTFCVWQLKCELKKLNNPFFLFQNKWKEWTSRFISLLLMNAQCENWKLYWYLKFCTFCFVSVWKALRVSIMMLSCLLKDKWVLYLETTLTEHLLLRENFVYKSIYLKYWFSNQLFVFTLNSTNKSLWSYLRII